MSIRFTTVVQVLLGVLWLVAGAGAAASSGASELELACAGLYLTTILFLWFGVRLNAVFLKVYCLFFTIWFLLRVPYIVWSPASYLYAAQDPLTASRIAHDLTILMGFHLAMGAMALLTDIQFPLAVDSLLAPAYAADLLRRLLPLLIAMEAVAVAQARFTQFGAVWGFLRHFAETDLILRVVAYLACVAYPWKGQTRIYVGMCAGAVVIESALTGSRAGIYLLALPVFLFMMARKQVRIRLTVTRIIAGLLFVPAAFGSYYIGTVLRQARAENVNHDVKISEIPSYLKEHPLSQGEQGESFADRVSQRVTALDFYMVVVDRENSRDAHEVSFSNVFKEIANEIVPGDIYPGNHDTALLFTVDYEGMPLDQIAYVYTSRVPGLFATAVALSSVAWGVPLMLLLWLVYLAIAMTVLQVTPGSFHGIVSFLIVYEAYSFFLMMGVDRFFFTELVGYYVVQGVIVGTFLFFVRGRAVLPDNEYGLTTAAAGRP